MSRRVSVLMLAALVVGCGPQGCGQGGRPGEAPARAEGGSTARPSPGETAKPAVASFEAEIKRETAWQLGQRWAVCGKSLVLGVKVPASQPNPFAPALGAKPHKGTVGYVEARDVTRAVRPLPLSFADQANGVEYRAEVAFRARVYRTHDTNGLLTGGTPGWTKWLDARGPILSFTLTRTSRKWEVSKVTDDPFGVKAWKGVTFLPRCAEVPASH